MMRAARRRRWAVVWTTLLVHAFHQRRPYARVLLRSLLARRTTERQRLAHYVDAAERWRAARVGIDVRPTTV